LNREEIMGPLVPDIITPELNLVIGLLLGIAFGFILEQAGFSSSRKLTGLFYGTDFTVLRVFFSAGVTAMLGVLLLGQFGLLDLDVIYINPTFLYSAVLGGAIMGLGFVIGGYCPGTSFCGAAVGRIDAMVFVLGGLLGIFGFSEAFPLFQDFYRAGDLGDLTVFSALSISQGQFALLLIVVAVMAFVVTTGIERRVNPSSESRSFPVRYHRMAGAGVVALGLLLAFIPDRKTRLLDTASDAAYQHAHPVRMMTADEMAFRILDRDPLLRPIDVRGASEYAQMSLPSAVNIQVETMFGKEWRDLLGQRNTVKIFFAEDDSSAVRAAALAGLLGYQNVAVLQGGLGEFRKTILNATPPNRELSESERDTYQFRAKAAPRITAMISQRDAAKPVRRVKKIQGGCGS
jgi:rhodanese-related sulfurtransferase